MASLPHVSPPPPPKGSHTSLSVLDHSSVIWGEIIEIIPKPWVHFFLSFFPPHLLGVVRCLNGLIKFFGGRVGWGGSKFGANH